MLQKISISKPEIQLCMIIVSPALVLNSPKAQIPGGLCLFFSFFIDSKDKKGQEDFKAGRQFVNRTDKTGVCLVSTLLYGCLSRSGLTQHVQHFDFKLLDLIGFRRALKQGLTVLFRLKVSCNLQVIFYQ